MGQTYIIIYKHKSEDYKINKSFNVLSIKGQVSIRSFCLFLIRSGFLYIFFVFSTFFIKFKILYVDWHKYLS